jgi:hypothetical protein
MGLGPEVHDDGAGWMPVGLFDLEDVVRALTTKRDLEVGDADPEPSQRPIEKRPIFDQPGHGSFHRPVEGLVSSSDAADQVIARTKSPAPINQPINELSGPMRAFWTTLLMSNRNRTRCPLG